MTSPLRPTSLRCEYRENPLGIDSSNPRLSWLATPVDGKHRALSQTVYQILVASREELLNSTDADLWNSQQVESSQTHSIPYAGNALASARQAFWKVRIWGADQPSDWSDASTFTMGLLDPHDWQAKWITADPNNAQPNVVPMFRRSVVLDKPVARAIVFICGLGHFDLHVNGTPASDDLLDPGWTNYSKTCLYLTQDVTSLLRAGENVLGVLLGNGMYNVIGKPGRYKKFKASFGPKKLILQLHIDFADGSQTQIVSDESWRTSNGPTTFSCIYGGEDYDARLEQAGWDSPGFSDSHWHGATIVDAPTGKLIAQSAPPIRIMRTFPAKLLSTPQPNIAVYDLGQNMSGFPSLVAHGPAGTTIKLIPGELLDSAGRVTQKSSGSPVFFEYTLRDGPQNWQPKFTYTGFRYLEAISPPGVIHSIAGRFIHAAAPVVGEFSCSDPLFNQIHTLINAAILSNMQSVLTDCPHREKMGWLEQAHLMGPAIMFNYDVATLYAKISADMRDAQCPNGCVPTTAPEYTVFKGQYADFTNSPEWGSAAVINPWLLFQHYGDRRFLEDNFDVMQRYVDYLRSREQDGIIDFGLGDWYDIGPGDPGLSKLTSIALTATAIYFRDLQILSQSAALLNKPDESKTYADIAQRVRSAFNQKFFHANTGQYDRSSQTANGMALALNLVDCQNRAAVLTNLITDIRSHNNHITAGDIGFRFVLDALADADRSDVIFDLLSRTDAPSYGNQLAQGATTLTEAWDANPKNSQNHLMLGHAEQWFYQHLCGIQIDLSQPAGRQIIVRPSLVGDISWADAQHQTVLGPVSCRWERIDHGLRMSIQIPVGVTAEVHVPTSNAQSVHEAGSRVRFVDQADVKLIGQDENRAVFEVGSGAYILECDLSKGASP
jgi:alpha-L-rhamnosidase